MTILITGVAGFIGSNFYRKFRVDFPKSKIVGLDNFSSGRRQNVDKGMIFYKGSIEDKKLLQKIFKKHRPEYVFHFAAIPRVSYSVEFPVETSRVNICGTVALLEISQKFKVKKFVLSSSSAVYGGAKKLPTKESESLPDPTSPYAAQKLSDEIFCKVFSKLYNLDTVCLRYFNVFGPWQYGDSAYSTVISAWLESLYFSKNKKPFIEGDGGQSRDFCYVDNVVSANIAVMKSNKKFFGEVFNIAHGERTTVNEVRIMIEKHSGKKLHLERRPSRIGDVRHTHADISKAKKWFGYRPTVDFQSGLKKTIEWFEKREK